MPVVHLDPFVFFKFVYLRWDIARVCQDGNRRHRLGLEYAGGHAGPRFVGLLGMNLVDRSPSVYGLLTAVSSGCFLLEVVSRLYFLGHLEVRLAAVEPSFASSLLNNVLLQLLLLCVTEWHRVVVSGAVGKLTWIDTLGFI